MIFDLVISGKLVDPIDGVYSADVGITKDKIEKVSDKALEGKKSLRLSSSQIVFPGFIDPHVHLREPGWEHKEDFLTGSLAAIHGGVTTVADMPNLPEPVVNKERLLKKIELAKKSLIAVLHIGGVNKNNLNDAKEIAPLVPAFKIYTAESTGELTLNGWRQINEAVKMISALKKPITFHCEDQEIIDKSKEMLRHESYPWKHCDERPVESEVAALEKVLDLRARYKMMTNIAHVSAKEPLEMISEQKDNNLMCEVTPHHLFFTKKDMEKLGNLLKINCPLREENDRRALLRGLKNGDIDMLATDHAPHTLEEKKSASPPSGMPGLDTYGNIVLWLMISNKIHPKRIAEVSSFNAAKYLGLSDRARIKEGFKANIVVLDVKGETKIRNRRLETKCGWSPFNGMKFPGSVVGTVVNGVSS